jgi:hypothetical protein
MIEEKREPDRKPGKEKKGNITIFYVEKKISDEKMEHLKNTKVNPSQIDTIIDEDADVYTTEGQLLLRFRKNKLNTKNTDVFYNNVIKFAKNKTCNRGSASGSKKKNVYENPKIMTNILGYFDKFSPMQKYKIKKIGKKMGLDVRETRFLMDHPDKFKEMLPYIKEIDNYYEKYIPDKYQLQRKKANQTPFKIEGTSFTTITTNVNFQTTIHKDSGDDEEGFGNLAVIESGGKYTGAETCFPQYGVGVNVRTGDVLFMDVHEWHGNLPMDREDKDAVRLSIVCYLRYDIWTKTKNKTKKFMQKHNETLRKLR